MGDISHVYGADIDLSASGDFLYVTDETQQHVVKRLLTAVGADLWNLTYGAGLGQFVGAPVNLPAITNAILSQIFQEESVAQLPNPTVTAVQNGAVIIVTITYADATTGKSQILTLPLGN
jgi:phage baseplate assembly protein W